MVNTQRSKGKKKPGGQPGNLNALKHGRYTRLVPPDNAKELPHLLSSNLEEEIRMLRQATRRLFRLADQSNDIDQWIKVLGALGLASIRTSRLLKSRDSIGDGDQAIEEITAAIREVLEDWNGDDESKK